MMMDEGLDPCESVYGLLVVETLLASWEVGKTHVWLQSDLVTAAKNRDNRGPFQVYKSPGPCMYTCSNCYEYMAQRNRYSIAVHRLPMSFAHNFMLHDFAVFCFFCNIWCVQEVFAYNGHPQSYNNKPCI